MNRSLSPWDGLIALQLFATCYSIVGIPIVHCGQLRAYSNQQPLTQVEYLRFAPWPYLFICVLIISMKTAIVLEDITPPDSASSQFTSVSARSLKGNLSIEHICLELVAYRSDMW